jgi:hypothetical protein
MVAHGGLRHWKVRVCQLISREYLLGEWRKEPRLVPEEIMLVSAQLESGVGEGRYNERAERYEAEVHGRKGGSRTDWTSYGLFQILGQNLDNLGFSHIYDDFRSGSNYRLGDQLEAYDRFMGRLLSGNDVRTAFRKYNGSGPRAEAYADRAIRLLGGGRVVVAKSGSILGFMALTLGAWVGWKVIKGGKA